MKFLTKITKFMYGRYGVDEISSFLFKLYFLLIIIDLFVRNNALLVIEILLLFITTYRTLSKNCYQRRKENNLFLEVKKELQKPFTNIKRNINDKDNIYRKCHKCKKTLKLPVPYERGIKHTKCPNCGKTLTLLILKKQKIEIIKNKG